LRLARWNQPPAWTMSIAGALLRWERALLRGSSVTQAPRLAVIAALAFPASASKQAPGLMPFHAGNSGAVGLWLAGALELARGLARLVALQAAAKQVGPGPADGALRRLAFRNAHPGPWWPALLADPR